MTSGGRARESRRAHGKDSRAPGFRAISLKALIWIKRSSARREDGPLQGTLCTVAAEVNCSSAERASAREGTIYLGVIRFLRANESFSRAAPFAPEPVFPIWQRTGETADFTIGLLIPRFCRDHRRFD